MVYLIGGAPRVGKSIAAKTLADEKKCLVVSTDDLSEQVKMATPESERLSKFPFPGFSGKAAENILTSEQLVELQLVTARSVEAELCRMVVEMVNKNESVVIEGVLILPEQALELITKHGDENIRALFVGSSDVELVVAGILKNDRADNWLRESNEEVIRQVADFSVVYSEYVCDQAETTGLDYMERTEDFEADVKQLVEAMVQ